MSPTTAVGMGLPPRVLERLACPCCRGPLSVEGEALACRTVAPGALDAASAYYFIGRKADRALTGREVVARYRGLQESRP